MSSLPTSKLPQQKPLYKQRRFISNEWNYLPYQAHSTTFCQWSSRRSTAPPACGPNSVPYHRSVDVAYNTSETAEAQDQSQNFRRVNQRINPTTRTTAVTCWGTRVPRESTRPSP